MTHYMWMLMNKHNNAIWFSPPASSAAQTWENAKLWEQVITPQKDVSHWVSDMKRMGWKAKRIKGVVE